MSKEEFKDLCKTVWKDPHGFVVIDLSSIKNEGKYRRGLDDFYMSKMFRPITETQKYVKEIYIYNASVKITNPKK